MALFLVTSAGLCAELDGRWIIVGQCFPENFGWFQTSDEVKHKISLLFLLRVSCGIHPSTSSSALTYRIRSGNWQMLLAHSRVSINPSIKYLRDLRFGKVRSVKTPLKLKQIIEFLVFTSGWNARAILARIPISTARALFVVGSR